MFPSAWRRARRANAPDAGRGRAAGRFFRPQVEILESRRLLSIGGASNEQLAQAYGQIPLSFEANQGQTDAQVPFLAHGDGYALFLTSTAAVLSLQKPAELGTGSPAALAPADGVALRMQLVGARAAPAVQGVDRLAGMSNYLIGNDPSHWHTAIPTYSRVAYQGVYPGIDLVYYGNQRQLEYDFTVAPGADPGVIRLAFQGAESVALDGQGNLVLHTAGGDVVEHAPVLYQEGAAGQQAVFGRYVLQGAGQVGFEAGAYDQSRPLVIDPVLSYSTYLGGSGEDYGRGIAVDASGSAYITGNTSSTNFPTTPGVFQTTRRGEYNVFVAKLNAAGTALAYSTYLGGSQDDYGYGIAVDSAGSAYIVGDTLSRNFPITPGAFQTTDRGAANVFLTKLNAAGSALVYSTYLGGSGNDNGNGIAVDAAGNAYVTGAAGSSDFPTTAGAFQTTNHASSRNRNAFVAKLNATGTALVYSTYLGGSNDDYGSGIAVDASGSAYVTGGAGSSNFPTTNYFGPPGGGAFVTKSLWQN